MIVVDPRITCRISKKLNLFTYPSGNIEIVGICSLTGKTVIRHLDIETLDILEFDERTENFISMKEGICKDYFNQFAAVCLPRYQDNVLEYRKNDKND